MEPIWNWIRLGQVVIPRENLSELLQDGINRDPQLPDIKKSSRIDMKDMNKLTLGIVLAAGLFTACSDKDDVDIPGGLALDKEEIAIGPQGGTPRRRPQGRKRQVRPD